MKESDDAKAIAKAIREAAREIAKAIRETKEFKPTFLTAEQMNPPEE